VPLRVIQSYLGHSSPRTTALYAHLTTRVHEAAWGPLNALAERIAPPRPDAGSDESEPSR